MIGFGEFGKKRNNGILSLSDERLHLVDTTTENFYKNVLEFKSKNPNIKAFCKAIQEVQEVGVKPFYRPVLDPSIENGKVIYEKGKEPAIGILYTDWLKFVKRMNSVEGKRWKIGSEYQYYAFLVELINQLVESGWKIKDAMNAVIIDSRALGNYSDPKSSIKETREKTGSREICGYYDLANTFKILSCTNRPDIAWYAGGAIGFFSDSYPLAYLINLEYKGEYEKTFYAIDYGVAWLVLE